MEFINIAFIMMGVIFVICVAGAAINVLTRPDHKEKEKREAHQEWFINLASLAFAAAACIVVLFFMMEG